MAENNRCLDKFFHTYSLRGKYTPAAKYDAYEHFLTEKLFPELAPLFAKHFPGWGVAMWRGKSSTGETSAHHYLVVISDNETFPESLQQDMFYFILGFVAGKQP